MKLADRRLLGGAAVGICLTAFSAFAQVPGTEGAPPQRQERPNENVSPNAAAAENYEPKGLPVGSFRLYPELELDEAYNDNVYATPYGTAGQTGSFIQLIKPGLRLRSDWGTHMLNFFANGNFGILSAVPMNDFYDYRVGGDGRYDIQRDWNVYAGASFNHLHEDPGTPNAAVGPYPPNVYNQISGNVGYYQQFNRMNVRADGRIDNYNYTNLGPGPTAGTVFNYFRDRTEFREALRFGYEFVQDYQVWVRGSLNQRDYLNVPDSNGFNRNSSGFDAVGGIAIDLGGITSVEVFAGYIQQVYASGQFPTVSAPTFGLTGYWNPVREVSVRPFVRRTIEESALTNAAAYLNTAFGVDADYSLFPNIKLSGHADYSIADYSASSLTTNPIEYDQYLTLRASVRYLPTANFFVGPSYQFVSKNSNLANANYGQNLVMLQLGAHF